MATTIDRQTAESFSSTFADDERETLADTATVESVVRQFIAEVGDAPDVAAVMRAADQAALVFAGGNEAFKVMPEWHTRGALGMECCSRLGIDPSLSLIDILRTTFYSFGDQMLKLAKTYADDPTDDWLWQVDVAAEWMTSLLAGTLTVTHPENDGIPDER